MNIEFDPAKDAANIVKHGISLARAAGLDIVAVIEDGRFDETRYRIYGTLDGVPHCLAATLRYGTVRAISFRRSHLEEYRRHAQ